MSLMTEQDFIVGVSLSLCGEAFKYEVKRMVLGRFNSVVTSGSRLSHLNLCFPLGLMQY